MRDKIQLWFANQLPHWLVYWATMRLLCHATSGKYGTTEVPGLTALEALKRWKA